MRFDFLTPEIFDLLVMANLGVAVLLIVIRFYQDMTHNRKVPLRERVHDESSQQENSIDHATLQQLDETQQQMNNLGEQ